MMTFKQINSFKKVLPAVMVLITRKSRYRPEIKWSILWTHNIFRFYELIFWRREGIRIENSSSVYFENGKKIVQYEFFSFESVCAHIETLIRNFFKIKWLKIEIVEWQLATSFFSTLKLPLISFAIAVDTGNSSVAPVSASPAFFSHTSTGSDLLVAVGSGVSGVSVPTTTSVTYDSTPLTKARADIASGSVSGVTENSIWLLGAASAGVCDVSAFSTGASSVFAGVTSYSGAQSSSVADAVNGTTGTTTGLKSVSVTTVANNCWVVGVGSISGGTLPSFTASNTSRWTVLPNIQFGEDNNAAKTPPGSVSLLGNAGGTSTTSYRWAFTGASFAPIGAFSSVTGPASVTGIQSITF